MRVADGMSNVSSVGVAAFAVPRRSLPMRPAIALQVALLLLIAGQVGHVPFLDTGDRSAPIQVNEFVLAGLLLLGVAAWVSTRTLVIDRVAVTALTFAAIGASSTMLTSQREAFTARETIVSLAYLARWLLYFGVYLYVISWVKERDVRGTWSAIETMLLIFAAFGIVQSIFLPDFAQIVYPDSRAFIDYDPQGHRLVSTMLEPNVAGLFLVIGLLGQLSLIVTGERVARWKMLLLFTALVLTVSRSAVLGLLFGGLVIVAVRGLSKRMIKVTAGVGVLILIALPKIIEIASAYGKFDVGEGSSAAARVLAWVRSVEFFVAHPVLGIGFNTFGPMLNRAGGIAVGAGRSSSEGGLLFVAVMTGVVGLVVFSYMLALVVRRCRSIWRHVDATPYQRGIATATAAITVAVCVHSVFVNTLFATFVMELLWVLWGLTFVIARELRPPSLAAARVSG
jgi:putative inorganic carbon (HCO3(-)) transporter